VGTFLASDCINTLLVFRDPAEPEIQDMDDDLRTIQRVLEGEIEAFRLLVEKYQEPLFAMIRNMLTNRTDCEDIAQEAFLAAYLHLSSYDSGKSQFSTWLFAIARNRCYNEAKRRRPVNLDSIEPPFALRHPADGLIAEEAAGTLDRALDSLPFEQRSAFVLAEIQDLPLEEVARIELVPLGTVKSRISRAKEKLRSVLAPVSE
jgi:RNA polymerase sigma-70 factor, ECF subfamily